MPPEYWHQVESHPGPEGISIALNFWQNPHLGVDHKKVFSPFKMRLKKAFSTTAMVLARERLMQTMVKLGLAREALRQYATPPGVSTT